MFNKDEKYIRKSFGKEEHFKVPEGYFDSLPSKVMMRIKEEPVRRDVVVPKVVHISAWHRYRKAIVSVAASVCVGMVAAGAYFNGAFGSGGKHNVALQQEQASSVSENSTFEAMMDYSMMDTEDMYAYMAEAN